MVTPLFTCTFDIALSMVKARLCCSTLDLFLNFPALACA